jgi:hypothetical protein
MTLSKSKSASVTWGLKAVFLIVDLRGRDSASCGLSASSWIGSSCEVAILMDATRRKASLANLLIVNAVVDVLSHGKTGGGARGFLRPGLGRLLRILVDQVYRRVGEPRKRVRAPPAK